MESNKDEAFRAKELAETKLMQKDIRGAQHLAIKAHSLYPALEGLSQFIATLDVYISAEGRVNGEVDWYKVLGVDPAADDEMIRKNYRKLALNLHPDKNKATGAEGAFKIISEAWSFLSDKAKKTAYDQKRKTRIMYEKVVMPKSSGPSGKNGFHSSLVNKQNTCTSQPTQIYPRPSKPNTFWTSCIKCHMYYEYLRDYLGQRLLCPNCHQPFLAVELPIPSGNHNTFSGSSTPTQNQAPKAPAAGGVGEPGSVTVKRGRPFKSGSGGGSSKLKRGREAESSTGGGEAPQVKRKADEKRCVVEERKMDSNSKDSTHQMAMGRQGNLYTNGTSRNKSNSTRELSQSEIRTMLMAKARNEIRKKLCEMELDRTQNPAVDTKRASCSGVSKGRDMSIKNHVQQTHSSKPCVTTDLDEGPSEILSMTVPDPDFHDFDQDRTEKSFGENEVWAAYDDDDGMPRFYALVNRVISKRPFRVKMSWLNSKSNAELGPMKWVGSGFRKTSGEFYVGKYKVNNSLNTFSHKVKFTKGTRGVVQIFPGKGEVWALYKNWSPDWNELTDEEVIHKYEMAVVLEDYTDEGGVSIAPLVKVPGFKSVFHQQSDLGEVRKIPREEMFRFSHQVPSYLLTGQVARNVPKGCRELDPAALPSELLQIITEAQAVENAEKLKKEMPDTSKKSEGKTVITYSRKRARKNA